MKIWQLLIVVLIGISQLAIFEPKHSKLDIQSSQNGKEISIVFKVVPEKDILVTDQAPWELKVIESPGLEVISPKGGVSKSYDKAIPGFTLKALTKEASGTLKFRLKAFVCTADKTRCFPEIHKGTYHWPSGVKAK